MFGEWRFDGVETNGTYNKDGHAFLKAHFGAQGKEELTAGIGIGSLKGRGNKGKGGGSQ